MGRFSLLVGVNYKTKDPVVPVYLDDMKHFLMPFKRLLLLLDSHQDGVYQEAQDCCM